MQSNSTNPEPDKLLEETRLIRAQLDLLNEHKLLRVYSSLSSLLFFMFLKGLAFGFGSVLGATIVVSILAYILGQFTFIPIIGEWARDILEVIQQ